MYLKAFPLTFCAQIIALFVNLVFLGQAFTIMLVYIWSRRNPYVRMNFFGLLTFKAPFLPWVLFGFSLMLGNSVMVDLIGKLLKSFYCLFMYLFSVFIPCLIIGKFIMLISHISAGIAVGHVYYFLEDVFPEQQGGFRILKTPGIM